MKDTKEVTKLTEAQRHEIFVQTQEAHWQMRVGVCSCGREFFSKGRHSHDMWLTHLFYEDIQAAKKAEGRS